MNYFLNINNVHASIFEIILVKEQKQGVWGGGMCLTETKISCTLMISKHAYTLNKNTFYGYIKK
jgi:hypothetical protein